MLHGRIADILTTPLLPDFLKSGRIVKDIICAMADPLKSSLADKLKSLGVKTGANGLRPVRTDQIKINPIQSVMDGQFLTTRRGETFLFEQAFSSDYQHGNTPLRASAPMLTIAQWMRESHLADLSLESFAFLDTETSGLAGGTGTYAFLVGVGRFEGDKFHLAQYFMRDPSEEAALLEGLMDFLAPCSVLVTFN
jgi:uncharacterized protein